MADCANKLGLPLRSYGFPIYGAMPGIVGHVSWDLAELACRQLPAAPSAEEVAARGGLDFEYFAKLLTRAATPSAAASPNP